MSSFVQSVKVNLVAIISLIVAVLALTLSAERSDRSERQRNVREASFVILRELSDLQLLVDNAHYGRELNPGDRSSSNPIVGWSSINYMRDLAEITPPEAKLSVETLFEVWSAHVDTLGYASDSHQAVSLDSNQAISIAISDARMAIKRVLRQLK